MHSLCAVKEHGYVPNKIRVSNFTLDGIVIFERFGFIFAHGYFKALL